MDIEDLSKSQLLLLTVLVNFVVSIATGVLTVSLLDQAPATVTETVNQVVDRTIQTIATSTPLATIVTPPPTKVVETPTTEQLLTAAITDINDRSVSIYSGTGTSTPEITVGTYLPKADAVVTATQPGLPNSVVVEFADGTTLPASISHEGATITIYGFADSATLPNAPSPTIVDYSTLKQGETVIGVTGEGGAVTGIVSKVDAEGNVYTDLPALSAGSEAVDLSGNLVGISAGTAGELLPADKITTLLTATSTTPAS